jgi:PAS domain S-box-containing protein
MSLWSRLFTTFLLCLLATLIFLGIYLTLNLRDFQLDQTKNWLLVQAKVLEPRIRESMTTVPPRFSLEMELQNTLVGYGKYMGVSILNPDGIMIFTTLPDNETNWNQKPEIIAVRELRENGTDIRTYFDKPTIFVSVPIVSYASSGKVIGIIDLNYPLDSLGVQASQSLKFIFATFMIAMLVGVIFIYNVVHFQIEPLRNLIYVASAISAGEYEKQFQVHGRDEVGQLARALQIMVSRLKSAISIAASERSTLQGVFEGVVDGLVLVDTGGRVQLANLAAFTMFGIAETSVEGKLLDETMFPSDFIEFIKQTKGNAETEIRFNMPQRRFIRIRATQVMQDDTIIGVLAICEDVTRIRLLEANEREFTQYISHELKTPLASLSASVETLQTSAKHDPRAQVHFLNNINEDIVRLTKLVNSLLTYQRIQAAPDEINRFGVVELILEIHSRFLAYANKKGILLDLDVPDDELEVMASRDRIVQVLINLVDNALRFTRKNGTVALKVEEFAKSVKISVIDTGVGIPKEYLGRLGERFIKIPRKEHQFDTNIGLGVAICKEILKRHGSVLEIESAENVGTTFSFLLKRAS